MVLAAGAIYQSKPARSADRCERAPAPARRQEVRGNSDRPRAAGAGARRAGASNKEIGREFNLAEVTVKLHVRQILRKIGARNRSEAASIATRAALL